MWSPLQAFFEGISSTVGRFLIALLIFTGGWFTSLSWERLNLWDIQKVVAASFGMAFEWASYFSGFGALIGLVSVGLYLLCLAFYVYDVGLKTSVAIFGMYATATLYFLPLSNQGGHEMLRTSLCFLLVCMAVWGLPWLIRRLKRKPSNKTNSQA
jgi:hypothetical protein